MGGVYKLIESAERLLQKNVLEFDDIFKMKLTSWVVEQRRLGVREPIITGPNLTEIHKRKTLSVGEKVDRALEYMDLQCTKLGEEFALDFGFSEKIFDSDVFGRRFLEFQAHAEVNQKSGVKYVLDSLVEYAFIKCVSAPGPTNDHSIRYGYLITPKGYAHLEKLRSINPLADQAFVAMWFDQSMDDAYTNGIKEGISLAGYQPLRLDSGDFIGKIDDEIIAQIRRSRFLVADFTQGDEGARGGVYYEAGFAHGLGLPVIFLCRADKVDKVHFDTRQYNHLLWEDGKWEELAKSLCNRICAVIGDGPGKSKTS